MCFLQRQMAVLSISLFDMFIELLAAHPVPQELLVPPYARGSCGNLDPRAPPASSTCELDLRTQPALPMAEALAAPKAQRSIGTSVLPTSGPLVPGTDFPSLRQLSKDDDGGLLDKLDRRQRPCLEDLEPPEPPWILLHSLLLRFP